MKISIIFIGMATETYQITVNSLQALHIGNQVITTEYDPETNKILRKSRTRLQNHYKRSNAYMRSLVRNNNCKDNDLFIKEYFVELKLREEYASRNKLGEILCLEQAYDSFQEIRIMSALPLSITEKLKILDFIKRFRENSIGVSIGDCFILSKETPVEVCNALYTIFNMMLEIRDIMKGKSTHCVPRNASLASYNVSSTN
ncbi:uncharacterized protein LOC111641178 isoform X2 [Centruroides sculpturatus]|uniref:uncharacterized protein LOC111641178 isoform X2 n=1 Tax=Centruroides sculpturatus TaxID=218467 RepID=UPI000C6D6DEE|nr:uncharacterized protein LOC111641178 isoform X2 [Centruroides sculpturatus]